MARQLAVVEAIMGQLYVAVLVARIVALSTARAMTASPSDGFTQEQQASLK
jgi:hypothetical protein